MPAHTPHACAPQLEQGLCGKQLQPLDGVTSAVFECLMLSSGELVEEIADPVLYLLGALTGEAPRLQRKGQGLPGLGLLGHTSLMRSLQY